MGRVGIEQLEQGTAHHAGAEQHDRRGRCRCAARVDRMLGQHRVHAGTRRLDVCTASARASAASTSRSRSSPSSMPTDTPSRLSEMPAVRSEEHTSELQSLMRISYAVFCLKKNKK